MNLFTTQIQAQQFIARMVASGYYWWVSGVAINKAELDARHRQYTEHYGCDLAPHAKSYRKKKGLANTQFIACPLPVEVAEGAYVWYLLATDGLGPIRENTKLKDGRVSGQRVQWGDDYVLSLGTRHRKVGGGTHWSWYIQPELQKQLDYYVGQLLNANPLELKPFFEGQLRRPLHHGVRNYLTRLLKRAHQNFTRKHPGKAWPARDPSQPLPIITGYRKSASVQDM